MKVFRVEVNTLVSQLPQPVQKLTEKSLAFHVEAENAKEAVKLVVENGRSYADKGFLVSELTEVYIEDYIMQERGNE